MDALTFVPEWYFQETCPSCRDNAKVRLGRLSIDNYVFGTRRIVPPAGGIPLARCAACGLTYKLAIPTPPFLRRLTALEQSELWLPGYDFAAELAVVHAHCGGAAYDLLDVGAAGGEFLRAAAGEGRRSALDIVRFDRLTLSAGGEFIAGSIDDPELHWSGEPYDVVTAFDILEHVYSPSAAMENLRTLTRPGGIIIIETGDTDAASANPLQYWYYLAYFEHHIAWNAQAIAAIAHRFELDLVSIERKRHKLAAKEIFDPEALAKYHCFRLSPRIYRTLQRWGRFDGSTPSLPNATDHMRVVLRRRP